MRDIELPLSFRSALESFTRDLTQAAIRDELDPVLCREREISRVVAILMRESKNNPVLVGEAGVGKTAVVEGLASRICKGGVPPLLRGMRILSLSHIDLIAGTTFRGQYERRLQSVIHEAEADPGVILFIDELHNLIGAGTALGTPMDAANMLKPALANGRLRVIGATTENEYARYICGDSALERRFQPVRVAELGREETVAVLRARRPRLEMHHFLTIREDALEAATDLSIDFLPDRLQPDRAIDLLDETCASWRLQQTRNLPDSIVDLQRKRTNLLAMEREGVEKVLALGRARGNPIERFSLGTFRVFEKVGLGVEKVITGQTTPRPALPIPDSVRRLRKQNPAAQLAAVHCQRLKTDDHLREALSEAGFVIGAQEVRAMIES